VWLWIVVDSNLTGDLDTFHFGSSLMVTLVKGPLFHFLQMFPNLCIQIYSLGLGFGTFIPNLVHSFYNTLIVDRVLLSHYRWRMNNFSNMKFHWQTCSHYFSETKIAHWLVKNILITGFFRIKISFLCCKQDLD